MPAHHFLEQTPALIRRCPLACGVVLLPYVCLTCAWLHPSLLAWIIDVNSVHFHDLIVQLLTPRVCSHAEAVVRRSIVLAGLEFNASGLTYVIRLSWPLHVAVASDAYGCVHILHDAQEEIEAGREHRSHPASLTHCYMSCVSTC